MSELMSELLQRVDAKGVATLTLSRGSSYNSLSIALMETLISELDLIDNDMSVRTVVIKGAGKGFCAGHDLKEMLDSGEESFYSCTFNTCSKMMQRIVSLSVPVIAQVHGVATAAGCQLVASCDLAYAAESARFGTPGVNIGLFCSTPMVALSRAVSQKHSMELLLTGRLISAARAEQMGLINQVVPDDELDLRVTDIAILVASKSRKALSIGKTAFYLQREQPLKEAYETCSQVMTENIMTEDAIEGIDAFITKRTPIWKHR
ncbi:Enoyl-CoA hydratase/carnithine racemase [Neptunomonas antarctica]|uniref:Enoyl-CoA hydratase domain-containing protein 3, mitochondrial n=2 Tax=Neptunomonas antarctica TaxID=619304 RepID=A0A1N7KEG0_9GAMM|nr:Enoyl-CoA hydratase/carnithine racemase [Neptunomonas antarctica]